MSRVLKREDARLIAEAASDCADKALYWKARCLAAEEALRARPGKDMPQCEPMDPDEEGWSDWVHPLPGYLLQCCDCGLVHDMEFAIGGSKNEEPSALNDGETATSLVVFRARRHDPNCDSGSDRNGEDAKGLSAEGIAERRCEDSASPNPSPIDTATGGE